MTGILTTWEKLIWRVTTQDVWLWLRLSKHQSPTVTFALTGIFHTFEMPLCYHVQNIKIRPKHTNRNVCIEIISLSLETNFVYYLQDNQVVYLIQIHKSGCMVVECVFCTHWSDTKLNTSNNSYWLTRSSGKSSYFTVFESLIIFWMVSKFPSNDGDCDQPGSFFFM